MEHKPGYEELVQRIAQLESDLLKQHQSERKLRRQIVYLTALHETALGLIKRLDVDAVLEAIISHTANLAGTEHAFLYLYDSKEKALKLRIGQGIFCEHIGYVVKRDAGVAGSVFSHNRSMIVNDYQSWEGRHPDAIWNEVQAVAALPLRSGERKMGVIGALYTHNERKFEDDILDLFDPFAQLAAIALENARLHQSLQNELADRKRAEAALQEKEATISSILQAAPLGIGMVNNFKDRMIVWTNQKFADMLGYLPGQLEGGHASKLYVSGEEFERVGRLKHPEMKQKGVGTLESRMRRKDGSSIDVLISSALIAPENPRSPVVFTAMDISARKKFQNALRQSEERFRELAELLPEVIFETDLSGNLTFANRKAFDQFGYTIEEFDQGLNAFELIAPRDREQAAANVARILKGENLGLNEYEALRKDGSTFPVFVHSTTILQAGRPIGLRGFMIDITERKKLEDQMQQVQRMEAMGTLAGGIAHDFNNLMMGIQGNTSLALLDTDPAHPNHSKLLNIEKQVKKATELTQQLLGLARGGKYEVTPSNLNEVIDSCVEMFSRTKKEIIVHKKLDDNLWTVEIDRGQIDQVLLNIFVNAWQAMPGGGHLNIQTRNVTLPDAFTRPHNILPGRYVNMSIADTGAGMDQDTLNRVFDPFFTTKEKERGTGLGLASAYGIIKNHEGIITAESAPGQGATFNVFLPASAAPLTRPKLSPKNINRGAETVLLVDDEDIIVDIGSRMLQRLGYTVYTAHNGEEAVAILEDLQDKIDIVILDMIMPGLSGSDTFDRLKQIDPKVKILLASGYSINGQAEDIIKRGCDGFIQKPFDMEQLSDKLRDILG